jgi:hypothetical protein
MPAPRRVEQLLEPKAAPDPQRWAYLPGGGRGPWQPPLARRARSFLVGLVKPTCLLGFAGGSVWFVVTHVPDLIQLPAVAP